MFNVLAIAIGLALPPTMPVDQIERGQRGQCLTVFEGDVIESFDFVVKGLMENFLGPGRDVVLIRLLGEKPEFTGVVAGMSGSPCSIDGRLMGALSYAFATFAKEPIAGVTPIEDMLEVMKLPEENRPWRGGEQASSFGSDADWETFASGDGASESPEETLRPIMTPLVLSGVTPAVRAHFSPWFRSLGFEPTAGSASSSGEPGKGLAPGSAIAAVLVQGDVDIAATGTVTTVEGDQVTAFGHPFMGSGAISIPMAQATILNTMASSRRSFKMSATGAVVGELTEDRLPAIAGFLGRKATLLPVTGTIKVGERTDPFKFEVARDLGLTPRFVAVGLASVLGGRLDVGKRGLIRMRATVTARGVEPIVLDRVYSAERDKNLPVYAAIDVARTVASLWKTPFGPPPDLKVTVDASVSTDPIQEHIDSIYLSRAQARPGDSVEVAVQLKQIDGPSRLETFEFKVPASWAGQKVDIIAASGARADLVAQVIGGSPRPTKLSEVVRWLSKQRADGHLYVMVLRDGSGMQSGVDVLPFLPGSAVVTLSGKTATQRRQRGVTWEGRRERPGMVTGLLRTSLRVMKY